MSDAEGARGAWRGAIAGRDVCVAGGRGAIGRRLVDALAAAGARRVLTIGPRPAIVPRSSGCEHVVGSILDEGILEAAVSGCAVVFHLAGLKHAASGPSETGRYYEVNTLGTIRVLEACRRHGVPRLVFASTAYVYGRPNTLPITESHQTAPQTAYGLSKRGAELALEQGAEAFGVACAIARFSNIYGASFENDTVVGRALTQAANGGPIQLRDLSPVRDFLHVDDAVEALAVLGGCDWGPTRCHVVNVSSGRGTSIAELVSTIARVRTAQGLRPLEVIKNTCTAAPDAVQALVLDNTRLRASTGWAPRVDLEEGVRRSLLAIQVARELAL